MKSCCAKRRKPLERSTSYKKRRSRYLIKNKQQVNTKNTIRLTLTKRVGDLKVASGCIDCGYREHPEALDFDHVTGHKRACVSVLVAKCCSWGTISAEIAKCEIRCAVCHRVKTHLDPASRGYLPRVRMTNWVAQRRADLRVVCEQAKSRACEKCGNRFPSLAMDLDHTDPSTKKRNVSRMIHSEISLEGLRIEIRKCRLLCANCHRVETAKQRNPILTDLFIALTGYEEASHRRRGSSRDQDHLGYDRRARTLEGEASGGAE